MWANLPIGLPYSASFKKYHINHHRYMGGDGLDVYIPTGVEDSFFCRPLRKVLWLFLQLLLYALRPLVVNSKPVSRLELMNAVVQFAVNFLIFYVWGLKPIVYLIAGSILLDHDFRSTNHYISAEFYDSLPQHNSWTRVVSDFVLDGSLGPYARIKREYELKGQLALPVR
uniref:Delta(4)-desaturase, sphingolipid 2 n=1 Tax=Hucho hucho TaxID=62062 RepID=A0A4W5RG75_9TELE